MPTLEGPERRLLIILQAPLLFSGPSSLICETRREREEDTGDSWVSKLTAPSVNRVGLPGLYTRTASDGKPCVFIHLRGPHLLRLYLNGRSDGYRWCATTANYDQDKLYRLLPDPRYL